MIIGAQKSGTTSLHHLLAQHPDIIGSSPKELHYFNTQIYWGGALANYRSSFKGKAKRYFESTPAYLYHPETAENIRRYYPRIKLIVLLREPGARAYSAWNHYRELFPRWVRDETIKSRPRRPGNRLYELLFQDRQVFPSFRECIELEMDLMHQKVPAFEPGLLRRGIYHEQLERYAALFGSDQIMVIGFKKFVHNLESTLNEVYDFIGVRSINVNKLNRGAKNKRSYLEPMSVSDRDFLDEFYAAPNEKLFANYGKIAW